MIQALLWRYDQFIPLRLKKKLINIDTIVQYSDYFETAKDVRKI